MNNQPCETCIGLAICINKEWSQILEDCSILTDYMVSFLGEQNLEGMIIACPIDSLRKSFDLSTVGPGIGRLHVTDSSRGYERKWVSVEVPVVHKWKGDHV